MESLIEKKLLCSSSGSSDSGVGQISYICVPVVRDELFPWIDQTFPGQQDQAVRHLTKLFSSSVHNKVVATEARVTGYIAEHLGGFCEDKHFEAMLALFVELSKFSVEGEDIKTFYSYVTGKRPICRGLPCKQRARQLQAYRALVDILNGSDVTWPLKFFLLEGERNEASIQMRANTSFDKKWPSEYAFMIWVMFDDIPTKDSKYEPRLIK